ncbi:acyl-CoA thioesterase [Gymnodinialimonas ceratoperidinii]|uniref:Acyl-CoA thioesterase n=1 Tax=Gymnodinialimonas ceratoperidinii TaxID=2856823 RepID=A0A8F6TWT5_9RHOB|nr:acyl-CoA thioesterase [Gymnodinialimonas ceratoperidinii]QXT40125.1 acyl-CoA thioesterase [Gymnodinialimonas ceratoperidinii]
MYPYLRLAAIMRRERRLPKMGIYDTHKMSMTCLPVDIDGFMEMNNGRVMTLFDLGRFALSIRIGLVDVLKEQRWGLVVAGSTVRYRARVTPFQRFELRTRFLGWDNRFFYLEQAMWRGDTCCNHALLRTGVTKGGRLAPVADVAKALGVEGESPPFPDWVNAWAEADKTRIWPPEL